MSLKPDAADWTIKEQVIEDPVSGLSIQFEVTPDGERHLRLYGKGLEFGHRDFVFSRDGTMAGAGTAVAGLCRPAWLTSIDIDQPITE